MGTKTALLVLTLVAAGLFLMRRSDVTTTASAEDVVHLQFWNGFTGPDGRTMLRIVRAFNDAHPDMRVTMQRMEWSIYFNKLMVAAMDGRSPEVFVVHASTLPRFARAGLLAPVDALLSADHGIDPAEFEPRLLESVRFADGTLGLPMDVHPQGLYVNAALLRQAGFTRPDGTLAIPLKGSTFLDAVRVLRHDDDGDGTADQWGFSWTMWRNNFLSLLPQFGGRFFDEAGRCVIDSNEAVAALSTMVSLRRGEALVPPPENNLGWVGFRQGKVAMVMDGVYMLGDLKRLDGLEYVASPMPQIGPYAGTYGDAHVLCVAVDLGAREHEAALAFMRFVSDRGLEWAEAGQVPARRSAREAAAFSQMQVPHAFAQQLPYVLFPPRSPAVLELLQEIDFAVEKALRGRVTPEVALREARRNFESFCQRAGLPLLAEATP